MFAKSASGAKIGITAVAKPDEDGMKNESGRNTRNDSSGIAHAPTPVRSCSPAWITVSII